MDALSELYVSYNSITSVTALAECANLSVLDLTGNMLTTLDGLGSLCDLRSLSASANQLTDVSDLWACTTIVDLDLSYNDLTDITAVSTLKKLVNFDFSYNQVTELPKFSEDCPLVYLNGSSNALLSVDALGGLPDLASVMLEDNPDLKSIDPLKDCENLLEVNVLQTQVTDVSAVKEALDPENKGTINISYSRAPV